MILQIERGDKLLLVDIHKYITVEGQRKEKEANAHAMGWNGTACDMELSHLI